MKIIVVSFLCVSFISFLKVQKQPEGIINDDSCKGILDSARVMVDNGEFTIHWQKREMNYERFNAVSIWMEHRPYAELKCLLQSKNPLYRMFGYINAGQYYLDSLDKNYSNILDDTTSLQVITPNGLAETHMTIGAFLKQVRYGFIEDNANFAKRPLMESKIKAFIKEYASYPATYQPESFPFFSMGRETGESLTDFRLRHVYKVENNKKQTEEVMSEFVFDPALNIRVIAKDSTNLYRVSTPELSDWFKEFGRKLTKKDSVVLQLK